MRARQPVPAAAAPQPELEDLIRPTGFFRNKSRNLIACAQALLERHDGRVPPTIEEMAALPGVGRKTANVLIAHHFGGPAVVVDTHLRRVTRRLGLTGETNPDAIERSIREIVPAADQTTFSGVVNYHGRRCCHARTPACPRCVVAVLCPFPDKTEE